MEALEDLIKSYHENKEHYEREAESARWYSDIKAEYFAEGYVECLSYVIEDLYRVLDGESI